VLFTVALGLLSRSNIMALPAFVVAYAGDTLWALMVYWGMRLLAPQQSVIRSATWAVLFSFSVECSQLYHAPWIDDIRATTLGGLVLGYGFLVADLVCYVVGVGAGYSLERFMVGRSNNKDHI